jgi:hypothetical protein
LATCRKNRGNLHQKDTAKRRRGRIPDGGI